MAKNILITGATGLIGRHIVPNLLKRGDSVIALTTNAESARKKLPAGCRIISWKDYLKLADEKIDAIINLSGKNVGETRWSRKVKKEIYDSRIISTRKVIELIKRMNSRPEVLINTSGADYYGNRGNEIITEESAPGEDFLSGVCVEWEKEAYNAEDFGVRVVIVRNGFVLAKSAPSVERLVLGFKLYAGGTIGSGRQYMSWIHINDIVRVYLLTIDTPAISTAVNGTAPVPVTMKEFCRNIGAAMHRPSFLPVPSFVVKIVAGEMSEVVLHGRRAIPARLKSIGFEFEFENSLDALKDVLK